MQAQPSPEQHPEGNPAVVITRRTFIKNALGVSLAAAAGSTVLPEAATQVSEEVARLTGVTEQSASVQEQINEPCSDETTQEGFNNCAIDQLTSDQFKFLATVVAPITEESIYRGYPSLLLDKREDADRRWQNLVEGTEQPTFTRKEILTGLASSILFGLTHNIVSVSPPRFNTKSIPSGTTTLGMAFWMIARKFGLPSSIVAHSANNYAVIRRIEKLR